jgi:aspartyl protease family protein
MIHTKSSENIIKMTESGGVYYVPCKINGQEMEFIFDTGASDIIMSLTEALFLYKQGKFNDSDFLKIKQYQIADGSIAEGTIVNLHTVEIGNKKLTNIKASIAHTMNAPLLLGQSALSRFGRISIDYTKKELKFE